MDNKCSKYEELFINSDKDKLEEHIKECEICLEEHKKMQKISDLIQEVKPHYLKEQSNLRRMRAAAALLFLVLFAGTFGFIYTDEDLSESLIYGETLTAEDLGFPVDSYGLLMVD